jgi:hypothetical protein
VKGETNPEEYFNLFRNSLLVNQDSHIWFRDKIVTSVDDHDHVDQGENKHRFAADTNGELNLPVMALNATTLGIPCIYYGTEQLFDGAGSGNDSPDRYLREAMFGGAFGPFRSRGRHAFNENQDLYKSLAEIHKLRREQLPLRRGRQYLRQISGDGINFGFPRRIGDRMRSVVAWSRMFNDVELLCAINTDPRNDLTAFVTLDNELHNAGDQLTCIYSSRADDIGTESGVEPRNGKCVRSTVPAAGFVVYG